MIVGSETADPKIGSGCGDARWSNFRSGGNIPRCCLVPKKVPSSLMSAGDTGPAPSAHRASKASYQFLVGRSLHKL